MNLLKKNMRRIISSMVVLALVFSIMVPLTEIKVEAAGEDSYSVNIRVEGNDRTIVTPREVTIDSLNLSDYPGIERSFDSLKPIHAIVKGLESEGIDPKDESEFTITGGFISMVNGLEGGWMYAVDNNTDGMGVYVDDLEDGQEIVKYFVETWEGNAYSWFEKESIKVGANEEFQLTLKGSAYDSTVAPNGIIEGASILVDEEEYKEDGKVIKTDSDGRISLKLEEDGTYHISAKKLNDKGENIISRPYALVTVGESNEEVINTIKSINSIKDIKVDFDTSKEDALSKLPKAGSIIDSSGNKHNVNLNWTIGEYIGDKAGTYEAMATFTLPEEVTQTDPETPLKLTTNIIVNKKDYLAPKGIDEAVEKTVGYYMKNNPESPTGDWEAYVGLWGLNKKINKKYDWETTKPEINEADSSNDIMSHAYALLAQGKDPSNVWGGRNLFSEIAGQQGENGTFTNIWKHPWAMLLLDAGEDMGADVGTWNDTNREKAVNSLLEFQNDDGSFGSFSKLDGTGASLIALSRYKEQADVKLAIDNALEFLKSNQVKSGGFAFDEGWGKEESSNSIALVIQGLVAVGEDIVSTEGKWSINGKTPVDALLKFQKDNGEFLWQLGEDITGSATKQSLVALSDIKNGSSTWLRLGEEFEEYKDDIVVPDKDEEKDDNIVVLPGIDNGKDDNIEEAAKLSNDISSPKTGDKGITIPIILSLISAITLGVLSKKRKVS